VNQIDRDAMWIIISMAAWFATVLWLCIEATN
jgi:hypothetical protein